MQPRQKLSELVKRECSAGTGGSLGTGGHRHRWSGRPTNCYASSQIVIKRPPRSLDGGQRMDDSIRPIAPEVSGTGPKT